ncbi:hypothetical protein B2G71_17030 [Novosphingobium sp. PC22D]|uniref:hypothetical protein n=1 Tax=Novosphingobium sp. PC22D TaxID=1962403 RepID=UPI000BFAF4D7|nr:hypothetical protein [Novosphingobium sp. PC22D]PEQ11531.1 hypothetical protein B2G71_17030 [Novosphingobium sp. PC22D]
MLHDDARPTTGVQGGRVFAAPCLRIAGAAGEMPLNTIAEKILGLPQGRRPDKGMPFDEVPA